MKPEPPYSSPRRETKHFWQHWPTVARTPLGGLFLIIYFEVSGSSLLVPVFQYFCSQELGLNGALVGTMFSVYNLARIVGAPALGRISDAFGRRIVLLACFFFTSVFLGLMSLAGGYWTLFFIMLGFGFGSSGNSPVSQAAVSDVADPDHRAALMGFMMAVVNFGLCITPVLLVMMLYLKLLTRRMVFAVGGAICFVGFCLGFCVLKESLPRAKRRPLTLKCTGVKTCQGDFRAVGAGLVCIWTAGAFVSLCFMSLITVYAFLIAAAFGWYDMAFGIIIALGGILGGTCQLLLVPPVDSLLGRHWTAILGNCVMAVTILLLPLSTRSVYLHMVIVIFMIIGMSLSDAIMPDLVAAYAPSEKHLGFVQGFANSLKAMACVIAPVVGGLLWDYSWDLPFYISGASAVCAALMIVIANYVGSSAEPEEQDRLMGSKGHGSSYSTPESLSRQPSPEA